MADDSKKEPVFEIADGAVTQLHGAKFPRGILTVGPSVAEAKVPSPEQSELVVNGVYSFARLLSEA